MKDIVTKQFLNSIIYNTESHPGDDAIGAIRYSVMDYDYVQLGEIMSGLFFMIEEEGGIKTEQLGGEYDGHNMFECIMEEVFYSIFKHVGMIKDDKFDVETVQHLIDNMYAYKEFTKTFIPYGT